MKIRKLFVLLMACSLFIACDPGTGGNGEGGGSGNENGGSENPGGQENPIPENISTKVRFVNNSQYGVNVYYGVSPYTNTSPVATVASGESKAIDTKYVEDTVTFFFQYNLEIKSGNFIFPYYPKDDKKNHQSLVLQKDSVNEVIITEITECNTKSAFLVLDNQSESQIYILQKDEYKIPYGSDNKFIPVGKYGVYEIGDEGSMLYETMEYAQICINSVNMDLPSIDYEANKIYVVKATNDNAVLETIAPFNIDNEKRMWSFEDSKYLIKDNNRPIIRSCNQPEKGSLILGIDKNKANRILLTRVDVYGEYKEEVGWDSSLGGGKTLKSIAVIDFLEQSDASIVILAKYDYEKDGEDYTSYSLICYKDNENLILWSIDLESNYYFRDNCKNVIFSVADNKIGVAGSAVYVDDNDDYVFYPLLNIYDFTIYNGDGTFIFNEEKSFFYELDEVDYYNESMFTSGVSDGKSVYVCGFLDCDFEYDQVVHKGIVYKYNLETQKIEKVLEKDRCLFYSIADVDGDWYASGEYWNPTGGLRGCYTNERMAKDAETIFYSGNKSYTWFNQFCVYANQVVLCGQTSESADGAEGSMPFVVAYDLSGKKLWENLNYTDYVSALNIIPNTIGTYIMQLTKSNGNTYYVSADLLGNEPAK